MITRRRFLAGSLAAAGWLCARPIAAAPSGTDPNRWVLLSDTHVWEKRDQKYRSTNPAENFLQVRAEILAIKPRPAGVIFTGDLVFLEGQAADYAVLADLVHPLRQAGIGLHFALGNHDHRDNFWKAFPETKPSADPPVPDKHVAIVSTELANWFLLDSLERTGATAGRLGKAQLDWLAKELDARLDRPALVVAHHPRDRAAAIQKAVDRTALLQPEKLRKRLRQVTAASRAVSLDTADLRDTNALFEVLVPRRQVKAYIFGHTHRWNVSQYRGIRLINLPTTAWLFDAKEPRGWVDVRLGSDGMALTLNALDKKHKEHGETVELTWRM
jgi:3',5'-cyclic AMP phosphodiesterase CpdA